MTRDPRHISTSWWSCFHLYANRATRKTQKIGPSILWTVQNWSCHPQYYPSCSCWSSWSRTDLCQFGSCTTMLQRDTWQFVDWKKEENLEAKNGPSCYLWTLSRETVRPSVESSKPDKPLQPSFTFSTRTCFPWGPGIVMTHTHDCLSRTMYSWLGKVWFL